MIKIFSRKFKGKIKPLKLNIKLGKKIRSEPNTGPYLVAPGDPSFREKREKVLTSENSKTIVESTNKRKDGKMTLKKQTLTNLQIGSIGLMALGCVTGVAHLLGSNPRDWFVATLLVVVLLVLALDYRK